MTGRYKINLNSWRVWEPEKRTAERWSLFINTCRLLANGGLDYQVTLTLDDDHPHMLIIASGTTIRRRKATATPQHVMPQPVKPDQCAIRVKEVEWLLPENHQ